MNKKPIGVYDSGMGGLVVLEDLIKEMTNENFIYVADGENFPYGTKTSEQIEGYNLVISDYLLKQNAKAICIACNTASSNCKTLEKTINVPLIKTIAPTVKQVAKKINPKQNNILIISTILTKKMGCYEIELDKYFKNIPHNYYSVPTQSFVDLVEQGKYGTKESFEEVYKTIGKYQNLNIDKIVLGCTHFAKLIPEIKTIFPNALIFDSGFAMAKELKEKLSNESIANQTELGTIHLLTTGDLESFKKKTAWFKYKDKAIYQKIDLDYSLYNK